MIADWDCNCVLLADRLRVRHATLFDQLHSTLRSHGIEVRLLGDVRDIWAKDYCPIQVAAGEFVHFRYDPDYLRDFPELRTGREIVDQFHELGECRPSDVNLDGGNVVGCESKVILTDKIYRENPEWNRSKLRNELRRLLRVEEVIVIPKEGYDPIGHVDSMVRFIDKTTVLANDYSDVDPAFGNRLFDVLHRHKLRIETLPYSVERLTRDGIPSAYGCFTNYLRTERVIVAPFYGVADDHLVLEKLRSLFLKVPVISIDCTNLAREGGVLNCVAACCLKTEFRHLCPTSVRPPD